MNKKEKANDKKMFQEADFPFPFGNAHKMYEMMTKCCGGEGSPTDCRSIMMRGMMGLGREEEAKKKGGEMKSHQNEATAYVMIQ